jgi:hypothetical protein
MTGEGERRIGFVFGALGGLFLFLAAIVRFLVGALFLATGHTGVGAGSIAQSVLFLVLGLMILFFSFVGQRRGSDRALACGIVLIVLALVGWFALGLGTSILAILGALFALIAGILYTVAGR